MSFTTTQLIGFGSKRRTGVETLVDRTLGTKIGNMTLNGGLAAGFDGTTSQGYATSPTVAGAVGWIGKTHAAGKVCSKVIVHGCNDIGYSSLNNSCTITLYGKNGGAPGSSTDGTSIGSITFTDTADESAGRTITSTDQSTAYTHWWVEIASSANIVMAELVMYELI